MIRDYLGSDYTLYFAIGLLIAWVLIFIYFKLDKKKILFFGGIIFLLLHLVFVYYISPVFLGLGTPDNFSQMDFIDDKIVLFDNEITTYEDSFDEIQRNNHLRLHIVSRSAKEKVHSELIGTNYSPYVSNGHVFLMKFGGDRMSGGLKSVTEYDLNTHEQSAVITNDGKFKVDGVMYDVFHLSYEGAVFIESSKGDRFILNPETVQFEWFADNFYSNIEMASNHFGLWNSVNSEHKNDLKIDGKETGIELLEAKKVLEYEKGDSAFCLFKSFADLLTDIPTWTMVAKDGNVLWQRDLNYFIDLTDDSGLEEIQLVTFQPDLVYLTMNEYLFEMDLYKGKCNWFVKL